MLNEHIPEGFLGHFKVFTCCRRKAGLWNGLGQYLAIAVGGNIVNILCKYPLCVLSGNASYMPAVIRFSGSISSPFICEISSWNNPLILISSPTRKLATFSYKRSAHCQYLHIFGAVTGAVICGLSPWSEVAGQAVNWLRVLFINLKINLHGGRPDMK